MEWLLPGDSSFNEVYHSINLWQNIKSKTFILVVIKCQNINDKLKTDNDTYQTEQMLFATELNKRTRTVSQLRFFKNIFHHRDSFVISRSFFSEDKMKEFSLLPYFLWYLPHSGPSPPLETTPVSFKMPKRVYGMDVSNLRNIIVFKTMT